MNSTTCCPELQTADQQVCEPFRIVALSHQPEEFSKALHLKIGPMTGITNYLARYLNPLLKGASWKTLDYKDRQK